MDKKKQGKKYHQNLISVIHGQSHTSSSFEFENLKFCLFTLSIRYCINYNNLKMVRYVKHERSRIGISAAVFQVSQSPTEVKLNASSRTQKSSEFERPSVETGNLPNTSFSLPGPWMTVSVARYWSPNACLPMQIGMVQPGKK
jgi:hypothetical protein